MKPSLVLIPTVFTLLPLVSCAGGHSRGPARRHHGRQDRSGLRGRADPASVTSSTVLSSTALATSSGSVFSSSGTSSSIPAPTQTVDASTLQDMDVIRGRRIDAMIEGATQVTSIGNWLSSLGADGKWPDSEINYTTGCDAQRANWPASTHWQRITTMSAAYHGGLSDAPQWVNNADLYSATALAMDWWFSRDMASDACLDGGGTTTCPCGTAGLWNTNWFSNVILVPNLVVQSCLLLNDTLTPTQASNCSHIATRAISPFYRAKPPGFVSGANILDMSKIGIDQALRVLNDTLVTEAYGRVHAQMVIEPGILVDGIKPDGSFGQHLGLLYNGNYGKDFANAVLALEEAAGGTQFSADDSARSAFGSLFDADQWMIFYNALTGVLHWDFSVIPRFITFPVIDAQATGSINLNLTQVASVGEQWGSADLTEFAESLSNNFTNANAGDLTGNRMFWSNDYMVHRGCNYVTTLKMYSSRTKNTECTNTQNPLGFHLADGTVFTYQKGSEYEDIAASWDWNLIPGTTVDYGATPLTCDNANYAGIQQFVGGASNGEIGAAVMRYTNPYTKNLSWQKAWFFLDDDVQHVMISNLTSNTNAPVYSVLDQKKHSGQVFINSQPSTAPASNTSGVSSLWHDSVGYTFDGPSYPTVSVQTGNRTGNWSAIGTSTQPPTSVDLFSAKLVHEDLTAPVAYTAYPAVDFDAFELKRNSTDVRTVRNDASVSAVWDDAHRTAMVVFWDATGGAVTVDYAGLVTIAANANAVVIYQVDTAEVTVSDPSQTLMTLQVDFGFSPESEGFKNETLNIALPSGGLAGSSVSTKLGN